MKKDREGDSITERIRALNSVAATSSRLFLNFYNNKVTAERCGQAMVHENVRCCTSVPYQGTTLPIFQIAHLRVSSPFLLMPCQTRQLERRITFPDFAILYEAILL